LPILPTLATTGVFRILKLPLVGKISCTETLALEKIYDQELKYHAFGMHTTIGQ